MWINQTKQINFLITNNLKNCSGYIPCTHCCVRKSNCNIFCNVFNQKWLILYPFHFQLIQTFIQIKWLRFSISPIESFLILQPSSTLLITLDIFCFMLENFGSLPCVWKKELGFSIKKLFVLPKRYHFKA